jgi:hypothetical protein
MPIDPIDRSIDQLAFLAHTPREVLLGVYFKLQTDAISYKRNGPPDVLGFDLIPKIVSAGVVFAFCSIFLL